MKGLQRYKCRSCGCNFTKSESGKIPAKTKRDAIRLYFFGMSMCKIAKFLGISDVSVLHWVRAAGYKALQEIHEHAQLHQDFGIIEIDEMWHFVKKRNSQFKAYSKSVEMIVLSLVLLFKHNDALSMLN